jgi:serine/threonine protein kinase
LDQVVKEIRKGSYWAVLGARALGKTTLLRQLAHRFKKHYCLYFNLEVPPKPEKNFYQWLMSEIMENIPSDPISIRINKNNDPRRQFLNFLEEFKPRENKKIFFLFDEVEGAPKASDFLKIWRTVYNDRFHKKALKKYTVVISGSGELLSLTTKKSSPFNIAQKLYMKDFSYEESEILIDKPLEKLKISIDSYAKLKIISQLGGHPQMLQHLCSNLVEIANNEKREIREKDVDREIESLYLTNITLDTLKEELKRNDKLKKLIKDTLKGTKRKYFPYKEFSITGAGSIVEDGDFCCAIRNTVYETFLKAMLERLEGESITTEKLNTTTKKYKQGDLVLDNSSKQYKIIKELAEGGIGVLFKARDLSLGRLVALKMLKDRVIKDKKILQKFYNEARIIASLDHPHIVKVYNTGKVGSQHFIAMEFIEGEDLLTKINNQKEFTSIHILYIIKQVLEALRYAHSRKVIHGDIKPQNIMITPGGEVKIVDFGLSSIRKQYVKEESGPLFGTTLYISPEQIRRKEIDERADIYSIGITMYHLVTGTVPFKGVDILKKHLEAPVPFEKIGSDVPVEIKKIIRKCLEKDRNNRYQSTQEAIDEIEKAELALLERPSEKEDIADIIIGNETQTVYAPQEILEKGNSE